MKEMYCKLVDNVLTAQDFVRLKVANGFGERPIEQADAAIRNGLFNVVAICDALSLSDSYCYAEKKMVSSVLKFGFKDTTISKWKAILELKEYFDAKIEGDVYSLF